MPKTANTPATLLTVANDIEAAIIVGALADQKVGARIVGGFTAGFIAEAPGGVSILVRQQDLSRAREMLADMQDTFADCDKTQPESSQETSPSGPFASLLVAFKPLGIISAMLSLVWLLAECFQWLTS